jgi:hypothetical protein
MPVINNKLGKFFGPSSSYTGYFLMAAGLAALTYSPVALTLVVPGAFMAFTYSGTIIDTGNRRIKPYVSLFGIARTGKWIDISLFSRFNIIKATKKYTSYSRGSVRFDMSASDIELLLINRNGTKKVVLKRFKDFSDARSEMDSLTAIIFPDNQKTD